MPTLYKSARDGELGDIRGGIGGAASIQTRQIPAYASHPKFLSSVGLEMAVGYRTIAVRVPVSLTKPGRLGLVKLVER
jgi:hypothetical protein